MTQWSPQQETALKAVSDWLRAHKSGDAPQIFRLFGYAGVGKSVMARHFAEGIDGDVCFAAYTGKAALVLRNKGCPRASTIHSLIYNVVEGPGGVPNFVLDHGSAAADAELIIIDEVSMVDHELGEDLVSFGRPILVLGDPAQLPPVKGGGYFTDNEPDVMLTEIHRQAADNPIIALSKTVREGGRLTIGDYGSARVIGRKDLDPGDVLASDQLLVGKNVTRRRMNGWFRKLLDRAPDPNATITPVPGDKLVCLKNNHQKGLLNGGLWEVAEIDDAPLKGRRKAADLATGGLIRMIVKSLDYGLDGQHVEVTVPRAFFIGSEQQMSWKERRRYDEFDFGYALTVHKSQGSQWDNVMVFDESGVFRDEAHRHLYTAITRAAERLTIIQT